MEFGMSANYQNLFTILIITSMHAAKISLMITNTASYVYHTWLQFHLQ